MPTYSTATGNTALADQDHIACRNRIDPPFHALHTAIAVQQQPAFRHCWAARLLWRDDSWRIQHLQGISGGGLICAESESCHPFTASVLCHEILTNSINHLKTVDLYHLKAENEGLSKILGGLPHPLAAAFLCLKQTYLYPFVGYVHLLWRDDSWKIKYLRGISGGGFLRTESESCHLSIQWWLLLKILGGHWMAITQTSVANQQHNPYASLSFVQPTSNGYNFWAVPPVPDYGQACQYGYQFGADFALYLLKDPSWAGGNLLGNIVRHMDLKRPENIDGDDQRHGCIVDFFSYLERLIYAGAKQIPPQQLADQLQGEAIKLDLLQQIREINGTEPDDSWFFGDSDQAEPEQSTLEPAPSTTAPVA